MIRFSPALAATLALLACAGAQADPMRDFVRVTCIPEAALLDVRPAQIDNDHLRAVPAGRRAAVFARHGLYSAEGLRHACRMADAEYVIEATQGPSGQQLCGAAPETYLTVRRNGRPLIDGAVLGYSCHGHSSLSRLEFGEPRGTRRALVCVQDGENKAPERCEFHSGAEWERVFPLDQQTVERRAGRE